MAGITPEQIAQAVLAAPIPVDDATQKEYGYAHDSYALGSFVRGADAQARAARKAVEALAVTVGELRAEVAALKAPKP